MSTPAEAIQAAIDKLTKLRDAALPGPLEVDSNYPFSSDIVGIFAPSAKAYAIKAEAASDGGWDEDYDTPLDDDAPHGPTLALLVTLHATIDAQIAILQDSIDYRDTLARAGVEWVEKDNSAVLSLARAILGEQVDA